MKHWISMKEDCHLIFAFNVSPPIQALSLCMRLAFQLMTHPTEFFLPYLSLIPLMTKSVLAVCNMLWSDD